jgi:hypothetical protein
MARYITGDLAKQLAAAQGLTIEQMKPAVKDASDVFRFVQENPWVAEDQLRLWGEAQADPIGPDRMNAALGLLRTVGHLVAFDDSPLLPTPPPPVEPVGPEELQRNPALVALVELIPKPALAAEAKRLDVDGRSSMDKPQLAAAVIEHALRAAPTAAVPAGDETGAGG